MASLNSWLSPDVMRALGWALIHSLWQCLALAALAAGLMAFSRRPSVRYLFAISMLVLTLAAPVATFFILIKSAPVPALSPANTDALISSAPETTGAYPVAVIPTVPAEPVAAPSVRANDRVMDAFPNFPSPLPKLLPWLVAAWLCGVVFFSLRLAGGFLLLEHKRRKQSKVPAPAVLAMCEQIQRQLGLARAVRYLECAWLQTPAVIGWFRPIILLPLAALTGLSEAQLRAVIAHELAHIRRLDAFVNLFQIMVETLLFYHPAIWWLNRRIRIERELCCDEIAVSLTGNRVGYARALTLMAEWEKAPMLAMAANRGPLSERIFHILGRKPSGAGQRMIGLAGAALFLTAALAAANALFGIAYPVPAAHAKENLKAALSSSQNSADRLARQVFPAGKPAIDSAASAQTARNDATRQALPPPAQVESPKDNQAERLVPPSPDLSDLLPRTFVATPTVLASSAPPVAVPNSPASGPAIAASDASSTVWQCRNAGVLGRVMSPKAIQVPGFICLGSNAPVFYAPRSTAEVTVNVRLADPADTGKMQPGKTVRLAGNFRVVGKDKADYISVDNARLLEVDPVTAEDSTKPSLVLCQPPQLAELSQQIGQRLCVQNDIVSNLSLTRPDLEAAIHSLANHAASNDDPNAISCHKRVYVRIKSSVTCGFNSFWKSGAGQPATVSAPGVPPFPGATTPDIGPAFIGGVIWNGR